ncbi:MAG TPA: alpha/beta fold hydrolase [Terriglobales bacterium]|nr:alpha/beta fold hydrolase [Terriglobales bacterium]
MSFAKVFARSPPDAEAQGLPGKLRGKLRAHKRKAHPTGSKSRKLTCQLHLEANTHLWSEALFAAEILLLHANPVYYGFGVPHGDDSGVVIIPGFLATDLYLMELHGWLGRIGYRPYFSGIGINADCPNLLIQRNLNQTVEKALEDTGRKIHLIGHSLGGVIARSLAGQRPKNVASVITLASPIRGTVANRAIIHATEAVRLRILQEHGDGVLPQCYTGRCTCNFVDSLRREVPDSMIQTAIYTRHDGIVDWRYCRTMNKENDFEVPGTHIGMAFNPTAYSIVAERLALAHAPR